MARSHEDLTTRVGPVLVALVDLCRQVAADLEDGDPDALIQVNDGPKLGFTYERALIVGVTDGAGRPGYSTTIDRAPGMGRPRMQESLSVRMLLTLSTGLSEDDSVGELRDLATAVMGAIDVKMRDDFVRAGAWDQGMVAGETEWIPLLHDRGTTLNVLFEVQAVCLL